MGILDFFAPKSDGLAYNPMGLPAGANPEIDPVVGYDELGQKIRRSRFDGTEYLFEPTAPKTQSTIKGAYRALRDDPAAAATGLLGGMAQGVLDAVSVPRRAMEGEPLTYGDIGGMAGLLTLGSAAGTAPAGALRAGLARGETPRAPFDMGGGSPEASTSQLVPYTRVGSDIAERLASHPSARAFAGMEDVPHGGGFTDIGSKQRDLLAQHTSRGLLAPELQPPEQATIDSLLGRDILSIVGDTTGRHTVTHLGGKKLIKPVKSMAGFEYIDIGNQGYAGAAGPTASKLREAERSVDPYYMSVMMANQSGDFAEHTGELVGQAARLAEIDPKDVSTIDNALRNIGMSVIENIPQPDGSVKKVSKTIRPFTGFPSVSDPNAIGEYISSLPTGTQRAAFVKGLDRAKLQQMGTPNIGDVRLALADQNQLGMDWGSTGYRGFTPDLSRGAYPTTLDQSTTYDTGVDKIGRAQTFTGTGKGIPANLMFRDSATARREKGTGGGLVMNSADYKVYESSPKVAKQPVDRQQVDIISTFREIEDRFGREAALGYAKQLLSGGKITGAMVEAARKANAPKWIIAALAPAAGLLSSQDEEY